MQLKPFELATPRLRIGGLCNAAEQAPEPVQDHAHTVIAIHGWLDNAASFEVVAEHWQTTRAFYAMELPGHGLSEHRPAGSSYQLIENVLDVLAFAEVVSPDRPIVLVGHSLGGIVSALVAASAPDRVAQLVLLDSLGPLTDEVSQVLPQLRKAVRKARLFRPSTMTVYPSLDRMAEVRMGGIGQIERASAERLVRRGAKTVPEGYVWSSDPKLMAPSLIRFTEQQVAALFAGIECPVCLICGDAGYFNDYDKLQSRLSYINDLVKHHVAGGHHFHMEGDVAKTVALIEEFLTHEVSSASNA